MTSGPALDPELAALLEDFPIVPEFTLDLLPQIRQFAVAPVEPLLAGRTVDRREKTVSAADGTPLPLSIISPAGRLAETTAPCVFWLHGGGMVMGDRFSQIDIPLQWLDAFGAVVVSVDYRLAPEVRGGVIVDDCYRALTWIVDNAAEIGIDPSRIVNAGTSAGGGLAAGVTLLARDRAAPAVAAQMLICPMLDHRNATTSSEQYTGTPSVWSGEANAFAWRMVLGDAADVSAYVSPALAADLSGLPPTYIDAGTAEVFRDEDVAYATRIWAAGGQADLHVWDGGCHGFDALFPGARLSQLARRARHDWLARILT